jgi:hypothetical protein
VSGGGRVVVVAVVVVRCDFTNKRGEITGI